MEWKTKLGLHGALLLATLFLPRACLKGMSYIGSNFRMSDETTMEYIDSAMGKVKPPRYISREFVKAVVDAESGGNPFAFGRKNYLGEWWRLRSDYEAGPMQVTEGAWEDAWSDEDPGKSYYFNMFFPGVNIETGIRYMKWEDNFFRGKCKYWDKIPDHEKVEIIAAAYNGGPNRMKRNGLDISMMPSVTKDYVSKINRALGIYK